MSHDEETALIRRAQAGERAAFVALLECHGDFIFRKLLRLTSREHPAEDLAQEVFLKAWLHLNSFQPGTCFRAWLVRIARNEFLNSRRKKCAAPGREGVLRALASQDPGPAALVIAAETAILAQAAEAGLPEPSRAAFGLRIGQKLPYRDIGRALSLSAARARWHVFHARRLLRQRLRPVMSPDF